jgi:hypothetical protein
MVQEESLRSSDLETKKSSTGKYNHVKAMVSIARRNGWDLENMGLLPADLSGGPCAWLTRKQVIEQNRLVKNALQRFSRILTSPVPADLQKHILRKKDARTLLPWEREALSKANRWRKELDKARPQILEELRRFLQ